MLGKRSPQRGFFDTDFLCEGRIPEDSFYGFLAKYGGQLFSDDDFASLYCSDNGRPSVPPSLLAKTLLLQCHDRVSDFQAWKHASVNLEWTFALGVEPLQPPFAKSTLQEFRAKLILHEGAQKIFERSLEFAVDAGFLKGRKLRVAVDTTPIFGAAAVKDTYNLVADGIKNVIRALTSRHLPEPEEWAQGNGFGKYFEGSIKGQADVDWEDEDSRREFLRDIVEDAWRLIDLVRDLPETERHDTLVTSTKVLRALIEQDVEYDDLGPRLRHGVAKDRLVSAQDPDMRHGRKSASQRFDGFKGGMAVDTDSGVITAVDVVPAGTYDGDTGLPLTEATEEATGMEVAETIGDAAYGDGLTRETFAEADRKLVARVPRPRRKGTLPKEDFTIDLEAGTCTCPAGQVTTDIKPAGFRRDRTGRRTPISMFQFRPDICNACPLRNSCTRGGRGRTIQIHPREQELRAARKLQASSAFREYKVRRQVAEHRIARVKQLGAGKARYKGLRKTMFQFTLAAAVANLTLVIRANRHPDAEMRPFGSVLRHLLALVAHVARRASHAAFGNAVLQPI